MLDLYLLFVTGTTAPNGGHESRGSSNSSSSGGFGGGAPGAWGGMGGGGGYSGGGNGNNGSTEYGGGGGSYIDVSASNATTSTGEWTNGSTYSGHTDHASFTGRTALGYASYLSGGEVVLELLP